MSRYNNFGKFFVNVGIDASNIRQGGGRTHLIELLAAADPLRDGFSEVCVWGAQDTLDKLPDRQLSKETYRNGKHGSWDRHRPTPLRSSHNLHKP